VEVQSDLPLPHVQVTELDYMVINVCIIFTLITDYQQGHKLP